MPEEEIQSSPSEISTNPRSGLARVFGVAVRSLVAVVLGVLLGWVVYVQLSHPIATINARVDDVSNRLARLEAIDDRRQTAQASAQNDVNGRLNEQLKTLSQLQADIQALQTAQAGNGRTADQLDQLRASVATLQSEEMQSSSRLDALEHAASTPDPRLAEMNREIDVLRLMVVVSQVRLFIVQGDYGQAGASLDSAQTLANGLLAVEPPDSPIVDVQNRLAMAQQELQARPLIAAGDLDIVWQLLVELSRAQ